MPMNRSLYPPNWDEIASKVKRRARWKCQNCDRPCRNPGESVADLEARVKNWGDAYVIADGGNGKMVWAFKRGRFTLTVAHLNHRPEDCRPRNLKAWCAPCHARYDLSQMARKKMFKMEQLGQLRLFPDK